jgi:hypothetical protein
LGNVVTITGVAEQDVKIEIQKAKAALNQLYRLRKVREMSTEKKDVENFLK